jgi:hypothetical protein
MGYSWVMLVILEHFVCSTLILTWSWRPVRLPSMRLSYGPPWAHYLGGYQDRLLDGPLELPDLSYMAPDGVDRKDYGEGVLR